MGWTGTQMTDVQSQAERRQKVGRLMLLTNLRQQRLDGPTTRYEVNGVTIEVVTCDGATMMARWWYSGVGDPMFPHHVHIGVHETVGVTKGYARFILDSGADKELCGDGSSVYIPPGVGHEIRWQSGVPSEGWLIAVPPDEGLLPRDDHGTCVLNGTSICSGPADCAMRVLTGGRNGRTGGA